MKIEQQVCTLEQAKKLNELGITQDSYFAIGETGIVTEGWSIDGTEDVFFAAFTVAELGVLCRDCISGPAGNRPTYYATTDEYADYDLDAAFGEPPIPDPSPNYVERPTQAQALADLLIWLLETKLLTPEEVNQRLSA